MLTLILISTGYDTYKAYSTWRHQPMRIIPSPIHGFLDYVGSLFLIFSPIIFRYSNSTGPEVITPIVIGVILLFTSLITRYEFGLLKLISYPLHLVIDFLLGAAIAISPFVFEFIKTPAFVWLPDILVGVLILLVVLFSKTVTDASITRNQPRRL